MSRATFLFFAILAFDLVRMPSPAAQVINPGPERSLVDVCIAAAKTAAEQALVRGISREEARRQLEIAVLLCQQPDLPPETANFIGTINADRARFARDFLVGDLSLDEYSAALMDRKRKLELHRNDRAFQLALMAGDSDGDLVPDAMDRCPHSPDGRPTDDRGCPQRVPRTYDERDSQRLRRALRGATIVVNPACESAPVPNRSKPLAWGRGHQTSLGTQGINLSVVKVGGMPAGCSLFYEIEFRFIDPASPNLPPAEIVNITFQEAEDLLHDPQRAEFGLPIGPALSAGRAAALDAFLHKYLKVTWRVRVTDGWSHSSGWSPPVTSGPLSGGLPG